MFVFNRRNLLIVLVSRVRGCLDVRFFTSVCVNMECVRNRMVILVRLVRLLGLLNWVLAVIVSNNLVTILISLFLLVMILVLIIIIGLMVGVLIVLLL